MVPTHALFIAPENTEIRIWRYMDLTKFISLLISSSIYFARSDYFEDIFEGSMPRIIAEKSDEYTRAMLDKGVNKKDMKFYLENKDELFKKQKQNFAISCWHMNDNESVAMWKIYLKSNEGIVIQSTYNKLLSELDKSDYDIFLGKVHYIDYENDEFNMNGTRGVNIFSKYTHKRSSFKHEDELRAIIWNAGVANRRLLSTDAEDTVMPSGVEVKVSLLNLIENIYVSPASEARIVKLVQEVCNRFGYPNLKVNLSSLNSSPYYSPLLG